LLLYTPHITPRLQYIAPLVLQATVQFTSNEQAFAIYNGVRINYSNKPVTGNEIWVQPFGLLQQQGLQQQGIQTFTWHNMPAFFKTDQGLGFDVFAAAFYLLTRYEEYLPHEQDMYGRYAHTNSLAYKQNFLHLPLVNMWQQQMQQQVQLQYPNAVIAKPAFSFLPTYDIDIAYSYRHHTLLRNVLGFFKDFANGNLEKVTERSKVYTAQQQDPFDVYYWLHALHRQHHLQPVYFFLLAAKRKGYDKNIAPTSAGMQALLQQHAALYTTGIHPSWQSGDDHGLLLQEKQLLEKATGKPVTASRQHYIRMQLPATYRLLLQAGITDDYSMGYGSINGFRASYTLPYAWYDLETETVTNLTIHPFCFMEANACFEQGFSAEEAAAELYGYYETVKAVNGKLITIFHNHFLTQQPEWLEWRTMYEAFIKKAFAGGQRL
jgi:hypothetical protein